MGYTDLMPTLREIAGISTAPKNPFDGISLLPIFQKKTASFDRTFYLGYGSLITDRWKLVKANGGNPRMKLGEDMLFDLVADPNETSSVKNQNGEIYTRLLKEVEKYDTIQSRIPVPPAGKGRKEFTAPKEWKVKK